MEKAAITLRNISKRYKSPEGDRIVLDNVTISIPEGQRVAVVGPNGSGKSTILRIILDLTEPDTGTVNMIYDHSFSQVAYVPQDYRNSLFPWLRLKSNIALHLERQNHTPTGFTLDLTKNTLNQFTVAAQEVKLKLDLGKFPYQLSGGEQQILVLLQALLRKPKLFIADEPLSAIDIHKKELILQYLSNWLYKEKPTTLIVSHDLEDAVFLADRLIVLSRNSGDVRGDILIGQPHPRRNEWRYESEFRSILKHAMEVFE